MRTLVLGAGGFIGQRIVAALVRAHGAGNVVAGVRNPGGGQAGGVEQRRVDVMDPASVRAAATGVTHVVNSVMGSDRAIVASARELALLLVQDGGVEHAVHLSSIAVQGLRDGTVREDDPLGPPADGYAAAKIEAERAFTQIAGKGGVILRPGLVYGPGSALWTLRIGRLVASGRLGPLGPAGEGICNLVHVEDVADAVVAACAVGDAGGRAFALVAAPAPSWNSYFAEMAAAMGVPSRPVSPAKLRFERAFAYPLTALRGPLGKAGIILPEAITPGLARLFSARTRYESSAVGSLLTGWRDRAEAIRESAAWLARQ